MLFIHLYMLFANFGSWLFGKKHNNEDINYMLFDHLGSNYFNKQHDYGDNNIITRHPFWNKPIHCLYGSPIKSKHNWYNFIKNKPEYSKNLNKFFTFNLTKESKILKIEKAEDLKNLPTEPGYDSEALSWQKIASEYDAVYFKKNIFYHTCDKKLNALYKSISKAMDVDSIVVFNLDCVEPQ